MANTIDTTDYIVRIPALGRDGTKPALRLGGCGVLISYHCNLSCAHCYVRASPEKKQRMSVVDAMRHFQAFYDLGAPSDELHITGGEPFLDFDYLTDIVAAARDAGFDRIGHVETNASWAFTDHICEDRLLKLRKQGVQRLWISCDIFHQQFVPLSHVTRLMSISKRILGEGSVIMRWPSGLTRQNHAGQMKINEIRRYFEDSTRESPERLGGRGVDAIAPMLQKRAIDDLDTSPCGRKMLKKKHLHIDPSNVLFVGVGCVAIGNATLQSVGDVLSQVSHKSNPLLSILAQEGPTKKLLSIALESGFRAEKEYASKCHLCYEIRRFLKKGDIFTAELGPASWYYG